MYLVVIGWLYVVLMMSVAEATNTTGSADHRLPSSSAVLPTTTTTSHSHSHSHGHNHGHHSKHHASSSSSSNNKKASKPGRQPGARFALGVLTLINLLNYIDR